MSALTLVNPLRICKPYGDSLSTCRKVESEVCSALRLKAAGRLNAPHIVSQISGSQKKSITRCARDVQEPSDQPKRRELLLTGISLLCGASLPPAKSLAGDLVEKAVFAGGCFWCMEPPFDKVEGIISTVSGYCGGKELKPTYETVSSGATGHIESLEVQYDPSKVTYEELLDVYWHQINPTQKNQQFCDRGAQYRSAIFFNSPEQKKAAEASKKRYQQSGVFGKGDLYTEVVPVGQFWPAEEYHQDYYIKNPDRYYYYRGRCGRDQYLNSIWGQTPAKKAITEVMG